MGVMPNPVNGVLCSCGHDEKHHGRTGCLHPASGAYASPFVSICNCSLSDADVLRLALANTRVERDAFLVDVERLQSLAMWAAIPLEIDRMGGLQGDEPIGPVFLTFHGIVTEKFSAPTLHEVIDKAKIAFANQARFLPLLRRRE